MMNLMNRRENLHFKHGIETDLVRVKHSLKDVKDKKTALNAYGKQHPWLAFATAPLMCWRELGIGVKMVLLQTAIKVSKRVLARIDRDLEHYPD